MLKWKMMYTCFVMIFIPGVTFAATGDLQVTCEPGVQIYIDDKFKGTTNESDNGLFIEGLSLGPHTLRAMKEGFGPYIQAINIAAYEAVHVKIQLTNLQEKVEKLAPAVGETVAKVGSLKLRSAPMGAKVYVDSKYKGNADIGIDKVAVGKHTILFRKGNQELSGTYVLGENQTLKLQAHFAKGKIINISEIERIEAEQKAITQGGFLDSVSGMVFVPIKGGCFQKGGEVCVADFNIGNFEVTQAQWKAIMGMNPSYFGQCGDNCPVESVSQKDVQLFISKLNEQTGKRYRLPTQAEWEFAARDGVKSEEWAGTSSASALSNYAWYDANSGGKTHPVGQKRPNSFGIYDMSGNVSEWCQDSRAHGGSWQSNAKFARTTVESKKEKQSTIGNHIGFRLVLNR